MAVGSALQSRAWAKLAGARQSGARLAQSSAVIKAGQETVCVSALRRFQILHRYPTKRATSPKQSSINALNCCAAAAKTEADVLRVSLAAEEIAANVKFGRVSSGQDFAIVISRVESASNAKQEGLESGQKLLAISSPMQSGAGGEMWSINERPSLRFVTDAIRMNRSGDVTLELTRDPVASASTVSEDVESSLLASMEEEAATEEARQTLADKLATAYKSNEEASYRETKQRQRRIQRRKEYMDRESTRDNKKFFIGLAASLFLPALGILVYAFSSGMLDRIGSSYLPY